MSAELARELELQRVNVVGCSGSGKSTLAKQLAVHLGSPYVELDALFWKPNWVESSDEEFLPALEGALRRDHWVLDGNYQRTQAIKWQRVQTVIWLDLPYWLIMTQIIRRTLRRSLTGEELWSGNRESLVNAFFSRDSIIYFAMRTAHKYRRRYEAIMQSPDYAHIRFIRLRSRREVQAFLVDLNCDLALDF